MISDIQCEPTQTKDYFKLSVKTKTGGSFEETLEKSEIRHMIQTLDNAI